MFTVQTEWDCPDSFPDLSDARYIAIDLETKDPNNEDLKSKGSGAIQGTWRDCWHSCSCRRLARILSYCTRRWW